MRVSQQALLIVLICGAIPGLRGTAETLPDSCPVPAAFRKAFAEHPTAADLKAVGLQFNENRNFGCAIAAFQQAVAIEPGITELHMDLANLLAGQHRFQEAAEQAEKAVQLAPADAHTLTLLAMIRTRLGQTAEAVTEFRKVVAAHPNAADAHMNLGIALADASDLPAALDEFTEAVRLAPHVAAPHFNRGRVLSDLRRYPEAEAELMAASKLAPDSAPILYRLALTEKQLDHYGRSAELVRKVVAIDPANTDAHRLLAQDLARLKNSSDAVSQWKKTLELDPDNTEALYGLIRALHSSDPEQAKVYEQRYEAVEAKNQALERAKTLSNFAIASAGSKDFAKATEQLKEALQVCGHCGIVALLHKNLGLIYLRAGNLAEGERELRTSLSLDPKDLEAKSALEKAERIRHHPR